MKINLRIGFHKFNEYEFDDNDEITLMVKKYNNMHKSVEYISSRGYNNAILRFLELKKNGKIKLWKKTRKILNSEIETFGILLEEANKLNPIKNFYKLRIKDLLKLSNKELDYFGYYLNDTNVIKYKHETLDIDPYYVGFWLGDGHTSDPCRITCGLADQKFILPKIKEIAKNLNLILKSTSSPLSFSLSIEDKSYKNFTKNKQKRDSYTAIDNNCINEDWIDELLELCKKLEISKKTNTAYVNFINSYDPFKSLIKNEDYFCDQCKYNTQNIKKKGINFKTLFQFKKNCFINHNKIKHNFKASRSLIWNKMSKEEKEKYESCERISDFIKDSKYFSKTSLWEFFDIYEKEGKNGLIKYRENKIKNVNKILLEFNKLGLKNNKHIPKKYLRSSVEDRKRLLAGLIDSDGTSGGKNKTNCYWEIIQKKKKIVDDIEILCKSLGMFTYRITKDCRAKKKDGTYSDYITCHRIIITPFNNWDIPVLLKRKEIIDRPHKDNGTYLRVRH